jgi:isopentenyldiphosphate isomerase
VVHVLVFDRKDRLLLQKRSGNKDVAPGKWDTSIGGHVSPGEPAHDAALREMEEELGITGEGVKFLYTYLFTNDHESELVSTFLCLCEGPFHFNRDEIEEIRFWDLREILDNLDRQLFSRHFEREIRNYLGKESGSPRPPRHFCRRQSS